jgi:hypothetical protein
VCLRDVNTVAARVNIDLKDYGLRLREASHER